VNPFSSKKPRSNAEAPATAKFIPCSVFPCFSAPFLKPRYGSKYGRPRESAAEETERKNEI